MAQQFLTAINLNQNELQMARLQNLATPPSVGTEVIGQLYFDTAASLNRIKFWDGSSWQQLGISSGSGTVTTISVANANGFNGTVATATTTPVITITTTITGVLKGNGTAISAATAGTDYMKGGTLTVGKTILEASTTAGASMLITSGVAPTTPVSGDFWNASGILRFYDGSTTKTLAYTTDVINQVLTGYTSGAGTVSSSDSILQAIQKLNGNIGALVTGVSSVNSATGAVTLTHTTNQGVSGTWTGTALSLTLGALTGVTSYNGLVVTANTGVVTTGTWNASVIAGQYGGTGVANTGKTITLGGNLTTSGAFASTFTMTGTTTVTFPTSGTLATTTDITNAIQGVKWKDSVRVATTAAGTLATSFENGDTVDGVVLVTGDRILIKDQSTASENGIYTVNASGAPTRATDADVNTEVYQMVTFAQEGSTNADRAFVCTTNLPITLGSTSLTFADFASASVPDATTTIKGKVELATISETEARTSSAVVVTPDTLANFPVKKTFTCAAHSSNVSTTVCTHNYGHRDVIVQVRRTGTPYEQVFADINYTSTTTLTVVMNGAISAGDYTIITLG